MDANQLAAATFYSTNWNDVVRCAFSGSLGGRRWCLEETSALQSILRGSLRGCFLGTFLFFLNTSPSHHLNNLRAVMTCVGLICSTDQMRVLRAVSIYLPLFNYFYVKLQQYTNIYCFRATRFRQEDKYPWDGPMYQCYSTHYSWMQSFLPGLLCSIKTLTI